MTGDRKGMTTLNEVGMLSSHEESLMPVLGQIVNAAMAIAGADFGNVQRLDPTSGDLKIVAQRGFPDWWVIYWNHVSKGRGACGTALERGQRVIVEDVERSPIFADAAARDIQLKAGVHAVQSTPLVSRSGTVLGMLSTHYKAPHLPDEHTLSLLDLLARQAADLIERTYIQTALRKNELRFRTLIDRIDDVFWVSDPAEKKLIYVSQSFEALWGRDVQQLYDHFELWLDAIHQDDRERVKQEFYAKIATGEYDSEYRIIRPDGTSRWIQDQGKPLGGGALVVGVARDITLRKVAEEAVRISEEQLRLFIKHAPPAIAMFDRDMRYLALSDRWKTDYGVVGDVIGRSHYELFPEMPDRWKEVHQRGLVGDVRSAEEDLFTRADGSVQWIKWEVRPWYREHEIGGITIMTEEVTDRVKVTHALTESEARLRHVLEETDTAVWDWDVPSGKVFWSSQAFTMMGYEPNSFEPSYESWVLRVHPEDREAMEAAVRQAIAAHREYRGQFRSLWPDGTVRWIEAHGTYRYGSTGQCERMVGLMRDITEQKQNETALQESDERFRRVFDNAAEGIVLGDVMGIIVKCNARFCAITGYSNHELVGQHFASLIHPDDRLHKLGHVRQLLSGEVPYFELENRYITKFGRTVWVHKHASILRNDVGEPTHLMLLVHDITKRKQAEQALIEKQVELARSQAQLRDLTAKLITAQEDERRRLACDLHDDVTQRLAALTIDLGNLRCRGTDSKELAEENFGRLYDRAKQLSTDVQRLAHELHPSILDHLGLEEAVREHVEEFAARNRLTIQVVVHQFPPIIPLKQATCLYRVLQESLRNVSKHANATHVLIRLLKTQDGAASMSRTTAAALTNYRKTRN